MTLSILFRGIGGAALSLSFAIVVSAQSAASKSPIRGLVSMGSLSFNGVPGALPTNGMEEINAHPTIYSAAVIALLWSQLEPEQNVFDDSAITNALGLIATYNATYPATPVAAKLRIFAGAGTPSWVWQLTGGPITVASSSGTIQIGAFWTSEYQAAWRGLQAHLAAAYDANPLIAEVAVSSCSSRTAEPFLASLDSASLTNMRQFGFSDAAYMACLTSAKDDYAAWVNTPLDFTFNAFRNSDGCTASEAGNCLVENPAFTIQVMDAFRAALGTSRGVIANHGLQDPLATGALAIYAEFQNLFTQAQAQTPPSDSPLEFQTDSPDVDWNNTIALGLTYHPTEIEIWDTTAAGGPADVSAAQLQTYASELMESLGAPPASALVSSATLQAGAVSPASLVTIFGKGLAVGGAAAITITDSSGAQQQAMPVYVSATQINAVLPANLAAGVATFNVASSGGTPTTGSFLVSAVAPGIFTANANGSGVAAAETLTVHADGSTTSDVTFACSASAPCIPKPIDVSESGDTVYLILYGTGFRNRSSLENTSVSLGTETVTPSYAGAQPQFNGLDQINVVIPAELSGTGLINLHFTADSAVSNDVSVQIQ